MAEAPRDADAALLLQAEASGTTEPLTRRDIIAESVLGLLFIVAAVALGLGLEADREWRPVHAVTLTLLFAVVTRLRVEVGAGFTQPVQLAFIPMLLLLPTPWVPLLAMAAYFIERVPALVRGDLHPMRLVLAPSNAWYTVGPVLVLVLADAQTPDWGDWPWYLLALLAQFVVDFAFAALREWVSRGIPPDLQIQVIGVVPLIDGLLTPLGLLAAFASESFEFAYLLLIPPALLLRVYAEERARRVKTALEVVDTERRAARAREALVAGASHEMLTPLAVVSGLASRLAADTQLDPDRHRQAVTTMRREVAHLRHLTRQFVDYTLVKSGEGLNVRARPTPVRAALEEVADIYAPRAQVTVREAGDQMALADGDRLQQMLMILVSNALKFGRDPIELSADTHGGRVRIIVRDHGAGVPDAAREHIFDDLPPARGETREGAGIGLFVCRALARAQGGEITAGDDPGGGARFEISLPAAVG